MLHEGFIETVKNTIKKIIERFIEFLKKLSKNIKLKYLKKESNDNKKYDEELKKYKEQLEKEKNNDPIEYEIKCFSSELTEKLKEYSDNMYTKQFYILSKLEKLVNIITYKDMYLFNQDETYDKINYIINKINNEIKNTIPNIKFSDYIIKYKTDNIFEIKRSFTGVQTEIRKFFINNMISDNDKIINECKELLSKIDNANNNDKIIDIDKTEINKITKTIITSIGYMQKISADMVKLHIEYENINNKLMQEALSKIKN